MIEHPTRAYSSVTIGEIVYSHGVPLIVTSLPVTSPSHSAIGGEVTYFVATYRGPDLPPESGLSPFVRRDGDTWTFQRATVFAELVSWDHGKTWSDRP